MAKKKHFYAHLVETVSLDLELDTLDLTIEEKTELTTLAESSIHIAVVNQLLTELAPDIKKQFLEHLTAENHDELWKLLRAHVPDPEAKIRQTVHELKHEMHGDIRRSKGKR